MIGLCSEHLVRLSYYNHPGYTIKPSARQLYLWTRVHGCKENSDSPVLACPKCCWSAWACEKRRPFASRPLQLPDCPDECTSVLAFPDPLFRPQSNDWNETQKKNENIQLYIEVKKKGSLNIFLLWKIVLCF